MLNYFFKNLNTLFLTCALAFISIANAQISAIDNKGTIQTILIPTTAGRYDADGAVEITSTINPDGVLSAGVIIEFDTANNNTEIDDSDHYESTITSITIEKPGTYKVSYRVTAQITVGTEVGTVRSGTEYILLKDGVFVPGSYSAAYHRTIGISNDTASASRILVLAADNVLTVRGNKYIGTSTIKTVANGSSFLVERIK